MSRFYEFALFVMFLLSALVAATAVATDKVRKDPTAPDRWVPVNAVSERAENPVLSSVLIGDRRKLVVIDGHLMSEGETLGAIKVWRIEADHAVVSISGRSPLKLWLDKYDMNKEVR